MPPLHKIHPLQERPIRVPTYIQVPIRVYIRGLDKIVQQSGFDPQAKFCHPASGKRPVYSTAKV